MEACSFHETSSTTPLSLVVDLDMHEKGAAHQRCPRHRFSSLIIPPQALFLFVLYILVLAVSSHPSKRPTFPIQNSGSVLPPHLSDRLSSNHHSLSSWPPYTIIPAPRLVPGFWKGWWILDRGYYPRGSSENGSLLLDQRSGKLR
jgi:hypothetical protein